MRDTFCNIHSQSIWAEMSDLKHSEWEDLKVEDEEVEFLINETNQKIKDKEGDTGESS